MANTYQDWQVVEPIKLHEETEAFSSISTYTQKDYKNITEKNNIVLFDYKFFSQDMYSSFKNNLKNVINQFYLDVPREKLFINGRRYTDPEKAYQYLNNIQLESKVKEMVFMLSTQTAMYLPCMVLNDIYCKDSEQLLAISVANYSQIKYLGETKGRSSMKVYINLDHIVQKSKNNLKNTRQNNSKNNEEVLFPHIKIKKRFRIFDVVDGVKDRTQFFIDVQLFYNLVHNEILVLSWKVVSRQSN